MLKSTKTTVAKILGANNFGLFLDGTALKMVICKTKLSEQKLHDFFGFTIYNQERGSHGIGVWDTGNIYHFKTHNPERLCKMVLAAKEEKILIAV
ncbi:MAG: hypothetical protein WC575_01520 [Patescibacteria group bacterium]